MAVLTQSTKAGANTNPQTVNILTSSDTFTYFPGTKQELWLFNGTAGTVAAATITGSAAGSLAAPGGGTVNYGAGRAVGSLAVGAVTMINLDDIANYLKGTITITGGTGLTAILTAPL